MEHNVNPANTSANIQNSTQSNPADVALLCGADSSDVQAQIKKLCGDDAEAALTSYRDTCEAAGKPICETYLPTRLCVYFSFPLLRGTH